MPSARPHQPTLAAAPSLPPMPVEMRQEQAQHWAKVPAELRPHLERFIAQVERKRAEYAASVGWRPEQVGYLTVSTWRSRRFVRVLIADRDLQTGVPVPALNERIFAVIEKATGDIFKVSTDGKTLAGVRGNVRDEQSSWRAITPFGIESR